MFTCPLCPKIHWMWTPSETDFEPLIFCVRVIPTIAPVRAGEELPMKQNTTFNASRQGTDPSSHYLPRGA